MILLNGQSIKPTQFSDHTSQVWKLTELPRSGPAAIQWNFESEGEFLHLAQLKDLLDSMGIAPTLFIPFLPYARQDKPVSNESTFALRSFARLLNALKFTSVSSFDPHSKVAAELINGFKPIYPTKEVGEALGQTGASMICFPDRGALEKYGPLFKTPSCHGEKVRDQLTGEIRKYDLVGNPSAQKVLIVDDICDGGATFVLLARQLLEAGAAEVYLYVSHGIFSKGRAPLLQAGIRRIFTKEGEVC